MWKAYPCSTLAEVHELAMDYEVIGIDEGQFVSTIFVLAGYLSLSCCFLFCPSRFAHSKLEFVGTAVYGCSSDIRVLDSFATYCSDICSSQILCRFVKIWRTEARSSLWRR